MCLGIGSLTYRYPEPTCFASSPTWAYQSAAGYLRCSRGFQGPTPSMLRPSTRNPHYAPRSTNAHSVNISPPLSIGIHAAYTVYFSAITRIASAQLTGTPVRDGWLASAGSLLPHHKFLMRLDIADFEYASTRKRCVLL